MMNNTNDTQTKAQTEVQTEAQAGVQPEARASAQGAQYVQKLTKADIRHAARYVLKHIRATVGRTMLVALGTVVFVAALSFMAVSISNNKLQLNELYKSVEVTATLIKRNSGSWVEGGRVVGRDTVNAMMDTGFIKERYLLASDVAVLSACKENGMLINPNNSLWNTRLTGLENPDLYPPISSERYQFEFLDGYDLDVLRGSGGDEPEYAAVVARERLDMLGVELGGYIQVKIVVFDMSFSKTYHVVGILDVPEELRDYNQDDGVLVPLDAFAEHVKSRLYFRTAEFTIDPERNQELEEFRQAMEAALSKTMYVPLALVLRDEVLREAVDPVEQRIALMSLLFPIIMAASALFAAGITALIILQNAKEAAIMRVLGTTKNHVRLIIIAEQTLVCLIGLVFGFVVSWLLGGISVLAGGVYLVGCVASAAVCAYIVSNRTPLSLIQIKE